MAGESRPSVEEATAKLIPDISQSNLCYLCYLCDDLSPSSMR